MDNFIESSTYIAFMDNLPEYSKLYFKIGRSIGFNERLRALKNANPFIKTILIHEFDCEYFLHCHLKKYNIKNEWFCINEAVTVKDVAKIVQPLILNYLELSNKKHEIEKL